MTENKRVAIFIDAENISSKYADKIVEEASNYGNIIVKRIFADWSKPSVSSWKETILKLSLIAEQQFPAVEKRDSSDISLIINAMTVLFEKNIDIFCLASSDSDFARLVQELREREKTVVGFGEKKTPKPFVNAFSEFVYIDSQQDIVIHTKESKVEKKIINKRFIEKERALILKEIIDKLIDDYGKALYSIIGTEMKNKSADFIPKNYGCRSLKEFINKALKEIGDYKIKTEGLTYFLVSNKTIRR